MADDGEGQLPCGPTARSLGVRLEGDIPIHDAADLTLDGLDLVTGWCGPGMGVTKTPA